jgi:GntR family transcriptional regulator, transcriptional repressor for pyruvate dehydrogenase complex
MRTSTKSLPRLRHADGGHAQVVAFVRDLIDRARVRPGDQLPTERELAVQIGVSRPTVRAGLRALAAMGIVSSRHGSGTYISDAPALAPEPLSFLAALHGFTLEQMYEARRILEVGAAGLAAERATPDQIASLAEEVASLFAAMNDPLLFLVHDIAFHRTVAAASGNPIVTTLVEMVSALYYDRRQKTAEQATDRNLIDAAEAHRAIYRAIRGRDADAARRAMHDHLVVAAAYQAQEAAVQSQPASTSHQKRKRKPS